MKEINAYVHQEQLGQYQYVAGIAWDDPARMVDGLPEVIVTYCITTGDKNLNLMDAVMRMSDIALKHKCDALLIETEPPGLGHEYSMTADDMKVMLLYRTDYDGKSPSDPYVMRRSAAQYQARQIVHNFNH